MTVMGQFGIGQPERRFEDKRLLCGNGRFQNDVTLPGQPYAYVLRSPHAHAVMRGVDLSVAQTAPVVLAIYTAAALAKAAQIVKRRYVISRVYAHFMEPRGAIGVWDPGEDRYTLYADVQYPHRVRQALATRIFKIPESRIRVIAGDVGGGFGTKGWQYPEHRLVLFAAKRLRPPGQWACERSDALPADEPAR